MKTKKIFSRLEIANLIAYYLEQLGYRVGSIVFNMSKDNVEAEVEVEAMEDSTSKPN